MTWLASPLLGINLLTLITPYTLENSEKSLLFYLKYYLKHENTYSIIISVLIPSRK